MRYTGRVYKLLRHSPGRVFILGIMALAAAGAYATARLFSASIVAYVVEETLIQKAPPGIDSHLLRRRLQTGLAACPDETSRLKRLLGIAQTLEKTQRLAPGQMDGLLEGCAGGRQDAALNNWNLLLPRVSN